MQLFCLNMLRRASVGHLKTSELLEQEMLFWPFTDMKTICRSFNGAVCTGIIALMCNCAESQNLFVADGGNIYEYTPDGARSTFATNTGAQACAFNSAGDLFVGASREIDEFKPDGTRSVFASGLTNLVTAMAIDGAGNVFAAVSVGGIIYEISTNGIPSIFAAGVDPFPYGLTFNRAGDLFVSCQGSKSIIEITPGGVTNTFVTGSGLDYPAGLAFNNAGDLFVADNWSPGPVYEYTPDGVQNTFTTISNFPYALAIDGAGNVFVSEVVNGGTNEGIIKIKPDGTQSIFASGLTAPKAFAFQPIPQLQAVANGGKLEISVSMPYPYFSTIIQASTNLLNWVNIYTNTPPFTFTNSVATTSRGRFYRAVLGP